MSSRLAAPPSAGDEAVEHGMADPRLDTLLGRGCAGYVSRPIVAVEAAWMKTLNSRGDREVG